MRREYRLRLIVNGQQINRVMIDGHYEVKHSKVMNDPLILELIRTLNGRTFAVEAITAEGWLIHVNDPLYYGSRPYRLIWCSHPDEDYIGAINAFRR